MGNHTIFYVQTSSFCVIVRRSTDVFFLKEAACSQLINKVLDEVMRNVEDYRSLKKKYFLTVQLLIPCMLL